MHPCCRVQREATRFPLSTAETNRGRKGASVREVDVSDEPETRRWLIEATKQRTVPQIFINGVSVGGFDDIAALDRRGQLDDLLSVPPSIGAPSTPR